MRKNGRLACGLRRIAAGFLAAAGLWMAGRELPCPAVPAMDPGSAAEPADYVPWWQKLLLGESALLVQRAAELGETAGEQSDPEPPQEAVPEPTAPQEPDRPEPPAPQAVRERTLSGETGSLSVGDVSVLNRTGRDLEPAALQAVSPLTLAPAEDGPQVLIMHTHTTEAYARDPDAPYTETGEAHTTDTAYNITRVGEEMTRVLTEMGFSVLHDVQVYDYPSYNGAYGRSRAGVEEILARHPTIRMVLDVHRDALVDAGGTIYKPVVTVDGEKTAQVMVLVGTDAGGADFPDWTEHLALALEVSRELNALWPGLARPVTLRTARFNQQLTKGSLLVEVGSHGNTLEEALSGARLFARALGRVLLDRVEE